MRTEQLWRRSIPNLLAATIVPILLQAFQMFLAVKADIGLGYVTYAISIGAGLICLAIALRRYALIAAVFYGPAMFLLLLYLTLSFGVRFFGEGP